MDINLTDYEWGLCIGALEHAVETLDEGVDSAQRVAPHSVEEMQKRAAEMRTVVRKVKTAAGINEPPTAVADAHRPPAATD